MPFTHNFPFDPSYGFSLPDLLMVQPPPEPDGFERFWRTRYRRVQRVEPIIRLTASPIRHPDWWIREITYRSTDDFPISGWLIEPREGPPRRGYLLGHGYGGIEQPPLDLGESDSVYLVPCLRGLCRSRCATISADPNWHVLHDIDCRDRYIIGGCVDDLWTGVTALLHLFPSLDGHIGYQGISFGGGIGALALAWDQRLVRGHLNVPSFGHQPLRLSLPTVGSANAVQRFARDPGHVLETLAYYDAAIAARHIRQPMHVAPALFDPAVAPPGQFAIYNGIPGEKQIYVLEAGHFDYPGHEAQEIQLKDALRRFFTDL